MTNDPERMRLLEEAWQLIDRASDEEKEELFSNFISALKEHDKRFEEPDNRFNSYRSHSVRAMDLVTSFVRRTIGYNMGWVPERFLEHYSYSGGRPEKYDRDTREINCFFIYQLVKRGASETQAMKLLMRLRGDQVMTQGHLRELRDTYRDYKKISDQWDHDRPLEEYGYLIAELLTFDVSKLEGPEKASALAVEAFRALLQELIDLMKANHPVVAKYDRSYPEIFGPVIDWIQSEYDDPVDYFYSHHSHQTASIWERRDGLREYLNTVSAFKDRA